MSARSRALNHVALQMIHLADNAEEHGADEEQFSTVEVWELAADMVLRVSDEQTWRYRLLTGPRVKVQMALLKARLKRSLREPGEVRLL